jgi:iron complex transport system permease protein
MPGSDYRRNQTRSQIFLAGLFLLLVVAILISLRAGSYSTPIGELLRGIFGKASDGKINIIVRNNRMPRILTAIIAGAGLGVSGCVLQAILRNPLASASTLGVSQGASFGAAFAIIVLNAGAMGALGRAAIPLCAFVGSMAVALLILGLSRIRRIPPEGIVLAGVAISALFTVHRPYAIFRTRFNWRRGILDLGDRRAAPIGPDLFPVGGVVLIVA